MNVETTKMKAKSVRTTTGKNRDRKVTYEYKKDPHRHNYDVFSIHSNFNEIATERSTLLRI